MTTLTERPCKLGASTNGRTEMHGDDDVPALDFTITDLLLDHDELNELFGPCTWESLYDTRSQGEAHAVLHPKFAPRQYTEKHEGRVVIVMGPNQNDIEMDKVKLASIRVEPLLGGMTKLSVQVQVAEGVETWSHKLIARQKTEIRAEITFGDAAARAKSKQRELPMKHTEGGDDEHPDPDAEHAAAGEAQAAALNNSTPATPRARRGRARDVH